MAAYLGEFYAQLRESYAQQCDAKALAFILASASTPAGGNVADAAILAAAGESSPDE